MKNNLLYIYFMTIGTGLFFLVFFLSYKPWGYFGDGKNITTIEELNKSADSKISVTARVYHTGYSQSNRKGEIVRHFYAIIIEDKLVIVPYKDMLPGEDGQEWHITGMITDISKNSGMKEFRSLVNVKYGEDTPIGISMTQLASYYIEPYYWCMGIFIFSLGVLSVLSLAAGFYMRGIYKKREVKTTEAVRAITSGSKSEIEESLVRDCIYSDDFLTMSKRYLKYGKNDEIIKVAHIGTFKLISNELIITLKNGTTISLPAVDENQMRSIQKCYNALLIYMPEITRN